MKKQVRIRFNALRQTYEWRPEVVWPDGTITPKMLNVNWRSSKHKTVDDVKSEATKETGIDSFTVSN